MSYKNEKVKSSSDLAIRANIANDKVDLDLSHAVYSVDLNDLLESNNLEKSEIVAWRHFGLAENGEMGVYETHTVGDAGDHHYKGFHYGGVLDEQLTTLEAHTNHPELDGSEHAFLRVNLLKIFAIWFKSEKKGCDYFYPLSPRFYGFEDRLYKEIEFLPILISAATTLLKVKR
jgi:hypothetical protein